MEKKYFLCNKIIWAYVVVHITMFSTATNLTTTETPPQIIESTTTEDREIEGYAWSAWGGWSSCSKSCGGGVAMQERQCLPRAKTSFDNSSTISPAVAMRLIRQILKECQGVDKRYHECNNNPCPGGTSNSRAEQCAVFDRRPFRGRFYTWVPYIDGNAPCMLNCRPLGQQFYASLALVSDGTPCSRQGGRAICVQGTCKRVTAACGASQMVCRRSVISATHRPRHQDIATIFRHTDDY